jgi:hypothetical protein
MFSRRIQDATQVHDLLAIQLQRVNRRSPDRRQADHEFGRIPEETHCLIREFQTRNFIRLIFRFSAALLWLQGAAAKRAGNV